MLWGWNFFATFVEPNYYSMIKSVTISLVFSALSSFASAQTTLWRTDTARHEFYRIPAVIAYGDNIIALTDNRSGVTDATVWGDVGSVGNISIEARYSSDRGRTWTAPRRIVEGFGSGTFDQSHGDAAVVRDRLTGRLLMMCASGTTGYGRSKATPANGYATALQVGRYYSLDDGRTWNGRNVTPQMYGIYDSNSEQPVERLFFASGRICQSRMVRKGFYYRLYAALTTNCGTLVVYSDDFGGQWHALGGSNARPAPKGDESKIEELPDGSVVLSCRMMGGRTFNVFTYNGKDFDEGTWAQPTESTDPITGTAALDNATNGELLIVSARRASNVVGGKNIVDGKDVVGGTEVVGGTSSIPVKGERVWLALQSVPRGTEGNHPSNRERRSHVSIYWKAFSSCDAMRSPEAWTTGWQRHEVTSGYSAYSTMDVDGNGDIAFLYEDNGVRLKLGSQYTEVYDVVFRSLTLEEITGGEYLP